MEKQMIFYNSKLRKTEKQRKSAFPNLGKSKNSEKWLSQHWENQKMPQAAFPTPWKAKKCRKSFVARSEMQKLPKTAFRLQATSEKH